MFMNFLKFAKINHSHGRGSRQGRTLYMDARRTGQAPAVLLIAALRFHWTELFGKTNQDTPHMVQAATGV
eukprot:6466843-Amphidinium_carterae.2